MRIVVHALLAAALCASDSAVAEEPGRLVHVPGSTKKVCQLTGDLDRSTGSPTLSQTGRRFGAVATDLGSSFEHRGRLYFLFGDTWGRPAARDAVAWTECSDPATIVVDFHPGKNGKWVPPVVPGIGQGGFEVPSGGISVGGVMYVAFTTDHTAEKTMGRSVLARSDDDGRAFKVLYELSRDKFINVSFRAQDGWVYIYGSGDYRKSSVCLARVKQEEIEDRGRLEFLAGADEKGQPRWGGREEEAAPLFRHDVVGEFSVAYLGPVRRYVMLYNSGDPRGITMRSAESPWGPWSEGSVIFDPWKDGGYGEFMHISSKFKGRKDDLSDPKREEEWGGEYGPYVMSRFTTEADGVCRIYYTMSTWNPYQVVVMRTDLKCAGGAR
ncbi:MAG: DUF4185 domain-containing protein [Planctomycetes bacterium]|nr:DUF4185 domain-containing protein [Planctomycetota bacterium]